MSSQSLRSLKATSLQFRGLASTALRSNGDDARVNIRRLLNFVGATPLLRAEIERAAVPRESVSDVWQKTRESRDRLAFPDDPLEELGLLHAVLVELARDNGEDFWHRCYLYAGKHGMQECVSEVFNDTVGRYTSHLRQVLELALLDSSDPAYDNRRVEVHVSGGTNQLNVAQDHGQIDAQQFARRDAAAVLESARVLLTEAATLFQRTGHTDAAKLEEVGTAVVQAMQQLKPSRFTLQAAKDHLETLANATTVISALGPHTQQLVALLSKYLAG